jgi:hypothetical protein
VTGSRLKPDEAGDALVGVAVVERLGVAVAARVALAVGSTLGLTVTVISAGGLAAGGVGVSSGSKNWHARAVRAKMRMTIQIYRFFIASPTIKSYSLANFVVATLVAPYLAVSTTKVVTTTATFGTCQSPVKSLRSLRRLPPLGGCGEKGVFTFE